MGEVHLAVAVLEQVGHGSVEHSRPSAGKTGGVLPALNAEPTGFHSDHVHALILQEGIKETH